MDGQKTAPELATELNFICCPWAGEYQNKLKKLSIIPCTIKSPQNWTDKKFNPPHRNYNLYFYKTTPINTTKHHSSKKKKKKNSTQFLSEYNNTKWSHTWLVFNHIFKCSLNCAKVEHCLILIGKLFQFLTALTENAERPKSVTLK